jgi:hypothetical protein
VLDANALTMTTFLRDLDEHFGGARSWALAAGVSSDELDRMSELLLE